MRPRWNVCGLPIVKRSSAGWNFSTTIGSLRRFSESPTQTRRASPSLARWRGSWSSSMNPERDNYQALIESLADGVEVDWSALDSAATTDAERRRYRNLRLVA